MINGEANIKIENPKILSSSLFGITYSILLYKIQNGDAIDITTLYKEYEKILFKQYNIN